MFAAGLAAALLARKGRVSASLAQVEPLTRPAVPPGQDTQDFLFGAEGDPRSALREHVRRHARELSGLSLLLTRLREVAADAALAMPSNLPSNIILPQPLPGERADWSLFDSRVFDVPDSSVVWTSGLGNVSATALDDQLFDRAPMNIISARALSSQRTLQPLA